MDDELLNRCRNGEREAFVGLFRLHGGMVQKISMRMTRNLDLQRDIYQEVAARVIENIGSFRGACKFTTWLYRITVNAALTVLSKEAPYKKMDPVETVGENIRAEEAGSPDRAERQERFGRVMEAVRKLPADYREILSLFYFAEQSIEEISLIKGKSEGAIKAVLWKGRRAIVRRLKREGVYEPL